MRGFLATVAWLVAVCGAGAQPCEPRWSEEFAIAELPASGAALAEFDDGTGPALYAGMIGPHAAAGTIHRWNGTSWASVGLPGPFQGWGITDLCEHDDGTGSALYASGPGYALEGKVAKWDGSGWTEVGRFDGGAVRGLTVVRTGAAAGLYAVGEFASGAGTNLRGIARWTGQTWVAVSGGVVSNDAAATIWRAVEYDDGSGSALYVGGYFHRAGGVPAINVARWNGVAWSSLGGGGVTSWYPGVLAMDAINVGTGNKLYVGGVIQAAGGAPVNKVAVWNGTSWSAMGNGFAGLNEHVACFGVHDDGAGPRVFAGGRFAPGNVAVWDGTSWQTAGAGMSDRVGALRSFDHGRGPALVAVGDFLSAGGLSALRCASYQGGTWSALTAGGLNGQVGWMNVLDTVSGPSLHIAGPFTQAGLTPTPGVAVRRQQQWTNFGGATKPTSLATWNGSGGSVVYGAGSNMLPGGVSFGRWDGTGWVSVPTPPGVRIEQLMNSASPASSDIFAASSWNGIDVLARWDGSNWHQVPNSTYEYGGAIGSAVFDEGMGPRYFVCGDRRISRWNGTGLDTIGVAGPEPGGGGWYPYIRAVVEFRDNAGPALVVAGRFSSINGVPANHIAKWQNGAWSAMSAGVDGLADVRTMRVFDDGNGSALFIAGEFESVGGVAASNIARWDGQVWTSLGSGLNGLATAMDVFDDGQGKSLWVGGYFSSAGGLSAGRLARWIGCPTCYANCDESTVSPVLNVRDFGCFVNKFAAGDPYANCDGSTGKPVLNAADFVCFLNRFAAGCP